MNMKWNRNINMLEEIKASTNPRKKTSASREYLTVISRLRAGLTFCTPACEWHNDRELSLTTALGE